MEDLKKAILVRDGKAVGVVGDKYFSTAPLGTVLSFAGQTAPHGYLLCDGASYKVADYPHLYAVIGNTYGGDSTNFNVPNLVDKFIQGSTTSGTEKEAGLPNITGNVGYLKSVANKDLTNEWNGAFKWSTYSATSNIPSQTNSANTYDLEFDASRSNAIYGNSDTVQPPALTMVYIIKAFHTNEGVDSGVSDDVVEYVEGGLAKKESVYITNDPSGSGILYNAAEYLRVNSVDTYGLYNLVVTTDTGESGECNFIYKHRAAIYGNIISENGVTFDNLNEYGTVVVSSTSANRTFKIKYLGEPTEDMSGLSKYEYTRVNKNALASAVLPKADRQNAVRNTDYLKSDRPYLKIARNGSLSHVPYYACETYILCNHLGNMGALSFIRTDNGASCVYKDIVGTLSLSVELHDEYVCWLRYSSISSEIITVYALNGYIPTVSSATSMT